MDQQQVDDIKAQPRQALLHGALEVVRRQQRRLHLGGDHHLATLAGIAHALPDLGLVAVHLRGIDVTVADADRLLDYPRRIAYRPRAESDERDLEALGFDRLHQVAILLRPRPHPISGHAAD